ncbi:MAG: alpha/beta fold hydrolase [Negativicutes bacterium]|nr:alpha/beta fold hydrolase [Negativicutes bacterium]
MAQGSDSLFAPENIKRLGLPMFIFLKCLAAVFGCFIFLMLLLYFYQDNLLFSPRRVSEQQLQHIAVLGNRVETISLRMQDGTMLSGWLVKNSGADQHKLVIYYGGNGDELSRMVDSAKRFGDWSVALINYRGYGLSEGSPSEKHLCSDALEVYDYFSQRQDVDNSRIMLMGRSLGTGVAAYVAANRSPVAVVLVSPYDSMVSVAQKHYPLVPVDWLLKHRFESAREAPAIKVPLLMVATPDDDVVPYELSKRLARMWGGPVTIQEIKGATHNSIYSKEEVWAGVGRFLQTMGQ